MPSTHARKLADEPAADALLRHASLFRRNLSILPIATALALTLAACGGAVATAPTGSSSSRPAVPAAPAATDPAGSSSHRAPAPAQQAGIQISVRTSQYGPILTDGANRTVYLFTRDRGAASTCSGACAAAWPPVLTSGVPKVSPGLSARLGTARRRDGTVQVTYGGHPLYYYVNDVRPGEILCQNVDEFGGTWLVVTPHGSPVR